jgi:glutamate-1-semialdehyde 2,1-aminomutase
MGEPFDRRRLRAVFSDEVRRFGADRPRSAVLAGAAHDHLLGGVPMAWMTRWSGSFPVFAREAIGARVIDVDGIEYVDFALGDTGAMCGHSPAFLTDVLARQATRAITTMLPSEDALWVAAELSRRFGLDRWQLALSATDANRIALRLCRHVTGRPKVLVFDWCYHGSVDETLVTVAADGKTMSRPSNIGPAVDPILTTATVQFNDIAAVSVALEGGDVACVLAEPALTNIGIVLPTPGFHAALRDVCTRTDTLLVIDETHTICAGPGGATAAWGLQPDVLTIGKPIGGGVPAAAFGMTAALAERLEAEMHADAIDASGIGGTLAANALSVAAVRATLAAALREEDFAVAIPLAERWTAGVAEVIDEFALPWTVQRLGCRAEYWFCPPPVNGAAAAAAVDDELDSYFHLYAMNRGVLLTPFHNMALLCPAHVDADVDRHTDVFRQAVADLMEVR